MQQSELVTQLLDECNKGDLTAAIVRGKVQIALRALELKTNWAYMDRFVSFEIASGAVEPRILPVPVRLKSIEFIRLLNVDDDGNAVPGKYKYLNEVDAKDIDGTETDVPNAYWKDGLQYLWLDNSPGQDYAGEMSYVQFTEYSSDDTFEPWLLEATFPLVYYETLKHLGPYLREIELVQVYAALGKEAMDAALIANEELEFANKSLTMQYR